MKNKTIFFWAMIGAIITAAIFITRQSLLKDVEEDFEDLAE